MNNDDLADICAKTTIIRPNEYCVDILLRAARDRIKDLEKTIHSQRHEIERLKCKLAMKREDS